MKLKLVPYFRGFLIVSQRNEVPSVAGGPPRPVGKLEPGHKRTTQAPPAGRSISLRERLLSD